MVYKSINLNGLVRQWSGCLDAFVYDMFRRLRGGGKMFM